MQVGAQPLDLARLGLLLHHEVPLVLAFEDAHLIKGGLLGGLLAVHAVDHHAVHEYAAALEAALAHARDGGGGGGGEDVPEYD